MINITHSTVEWFTHMQTIYSQSRFHCFPPPTNSFIAFDCEGGHALALCLSIQAIRHIHLLWVHIYSKAHRRAHYRSLDSRGNNLKQVNQLRVILVVWIWVCFVWPRVGIDIPYAICIWIQHIDVNIVLGSGKSEVFLVCINVHWNAVIFHFIYNARCPIKNATIYFNIHFYLLNIFLMMSTCELRL